jgi:hypothetical protein
VTNNLIRAIYPDDTDISVPKELAAFEILLNGSAELYFGEVDHAKMIRAYRNDDRDYLDTLYKRHCAMATYHFRQAKSLGSLGDSLGAAKALGEAKGYRLAAMENYCGNSDLKEQYYSERQKSNAAQSRPNALQRLIIEIVAKNPDISQTDLLIEIERASGLGVINEVIDGEISFNDNGREKCAPVSGLRGRLSRAKKRLNHANPPACQKQRRKRGNESRLLLRRAIRLRLIINRCQGFRAWRLFLRCR